MRYKTSISPLVIALGLMILILPLTAQAYVGPGAGLSLLGALWGLIAAVGVALFFIVMWPIRRMRRRKKEAQVQLNESNSGDRD